MKDSLQQYLEEIAEEPLLTAQQEKELSQLAQGGDIKARDQLIKANLLLVVTIAKRYQGRGIDLDDLISEANFGLFDAVERFDPAFGLRFSTYATHWIKNKLNLSISTKARTIVIPRYMRDVLIQYNRVLKTMPEASFDEVVTVLKLTTRQRDLLTKVMCLSVPVEIETVDMPMQEKETMEEDEKQKVLAAVETLPEREREIIRLRFLEPDSLTMEQIGAIYAVTKQAIKNSFDVGLRKLRKHFSVAV